MTYYETVNYLYSSAPLFQQKGADAYKPGLQTTKALDQYFGHPHRHYPTIHVGGTNGKGSTCHTLAAILQASGLRVGLFTSPHLVDFRERIRINGQMIPQDYVVRFVEEHRHFFEPLHPSFFELTTAMALRYFADEHVDIAVIEVGLGGRLDCTNIITPLLSIVTNISLDHTALLGDTPEAIALEKAGIFKPGIPALIGEATPATRRVFEEAARKVGAPLHFAEDHPEVLKSTFGAHANHIRYETCSFGNLQGQLTGLCQPHNANTVLCSVRLLRQTPLASAFSDKAVKQGFTTVCDTTGLQGRWQRIHQQPDVIIDTGHNVGGWEYLRLQLHEMGVHYVKSHIYYILGFAGDKDVESLLRLLPCQGVTYLWTRASVDRAMPSEELQRRANAQHLDGHAYPTVHAAIAEALHQAAPEDIIFIGGSTFVVADALQDPNLQKQHDK